jgi:Protein C10
MPLAVQLLTPILTTYGYAPDQGGLMQFVAAGSTWKDDEEIVRLGLEMRAQLIPPVMLPMVQAMMAGMPQAPPA